MMVIVPQVWGQQFMQQGCRQQQYRAAPQRQASATLPIPIKRKKARIIENRQYDRMKMFSLFKDST
jgi:hypothetical protein